MASDTRPSLILRKGWSPSTEETRNMRAFGSERTQRFASAIALGLCKLCELSLLTAVLAVPLMYIYSIPPEWAGKFIQSVNELFRSEERPINVGYAIWVTQLRYFLEGTAPVLELKFATWAICGALTFAAFGVARCAAPLLGRAVLAPLRPERPELPAWQRKWPLAAMLAFLAWSFVSIVLWPPDIPADSSISVTGSAFKSGGGFTHSLTAWCQTAFALLYLIVVNDLCRNRRIVQKILGLFILVGFVCALFTVLLQLRPAPLMAVWMKWSETDSRNALGSFIGHNTGVSAFLMAPLFLSLGLLATRRRIMYPLERWGLYAAVATMCLALVLAQSRAVIPIVLAGSAVLAYAFARWAGFRVPRRFYYGAGIVLLLLVFSQLIPNPLSRKDVTLRQRLTDVSAPKLLAETRLRILAIGSTMIAEAPVLGTSFGSFPYTYPQAQWAYFAKHPRSILAPTALRSKHAHNEYLQLAIETGAIGLAIALSGLFFAMRLGWKAMRATLDQQRTMLQAVLLVSLLALLLQVGVDITLRVAPVGMQLVMLLAIWMAGGRLWPVALEEPPATAQKAKWLRIREPFATATATLALALLSAGVFTGFCYLAARTAGRWWAGNALISAGNACSDLASQAYQGGNDSAASAYNTEALRDLKEALYYLPSAGHLSFNRGLAESMAAQLRFWQANRAKQEGDAELDRDARAAGEHFAVQAISSFNASLSELSSADVYYARSLIAREAYRFGPPDKQDAFKALWHADLERAASMNPGNSEVLLEWAMVAGTKPDSGPTVQRSVLGTLAYYNLPFFEKYVVAEALDALYLSDHARARARMAEVIEATKADSDSHPLRREAHIRHLQILASAQIFTNDANAARATLTRLSAMKPDGEAGLALQRWLDLKWAEYHIRAAAPGTDREVPDQLDKALSQVRKVLRATDSNSYEHAIGTIMECFILESLRPPNDPELPKMNEAVEQLIRQDLTNLQRAGAILYDVFNQPGRALPWLRRRYARTDVPADLQTRVQYARALERQENFEEAADVLDSLVVAMPESPSPETLRILRALEESISREVQKRRSLAPGQLPQEQP